MSNSQYDHDLVLNLLGHSKDPMNFEDGEAMQRAKKLSGKDDLTSASLKSYKMQLAFYLGDLPKAIEVS